MAKKKATAKKATKKAATKKAKKTTKATDAAAGDGEEAPKKKAKKKRKSRKKKADEVVRRKIYWGVYTHAMKLVAKYEFNQKKAATKRAEELSPEGKPPHFVQKIKEEIVETVEPVDGEAAEEAAPKKKAAKKKAKKS